MMCNTRTMDAEFCMQDEHLLCIQLIDRNLTFANVACFMLVCSQLN
jgi:hypothetical protein